MIFANKYFLLLIPAAVTAAWLISALHKSRTAALKFPSPLDFRPKTAVRAQLFKGFACVSRPAVLILIALALARPQLISRGALPPAEGVDIILCIDTSTSMSALDFEPVNRLEAAKKAARDFILKRKDDKIGIVVFSVNALLQCPLTLDYQSLLEFLDDVYIGMTHSDGTAIGDAIAASVNHLKNSPAKSKVIILLTDGRSNSGIIADPSLAAKTAAAYGIRIYTIGTAGKGPAKIPINHPIFGQTVGTLEEDLDEGTLLAISNITSGSFFRATNYDELKNIYKKIDALEKTEFKNPAITSYNDRYLIFLLPALLLVILEFVFSSAVFIRIP